MPLVPYDLSQREDSLPLEAPPSDPIAGAAWLHGVLRRELYEVLRDGSLSEKDRREQMHRISQRLVQAPAHGGYRSRARTDPCSPLAH